MPGMSMVSQDVARNLKVDLIEEKIDGTRITFDGSNIVSDRNVNRNDRYPHILEEIEGLPFKCRGEIALPGGNILLLNRKENWHKAKYYIFELYDFEGINFANKSPSEQRKMIDKIVKKFSFNNVTVPKKFKTFEQGWKHIKRVQGEGLVLKEKSGVAWKVKNLIEEKLPIVGYEQGKAKGAFLIERNGQVSKLSGTSAMFVQAYHALVEQGLEPYAEIEYSFLTHHGVPYQPRLRRLGTLDDLAVT